MESSDDTAELSLPLEARVQRDVLERELFGRAPGVFCGRYRLERLLRRDAVALVFEAHDATTGRRVALRALPNPADNDDAKNTLNRAVALAGTRHPNIVSVLDVGEFGPHALVVTDRVEGQTLRDWLSATRRPIEDIVAVFGAIASGLSAIHRAGAVHGAFGPDSVVVTPNGAAKIADCGEALGPSQGGYAAPEVLGGAEPDARSDQFSFCTTLFEAVARRLPFALSDPAATQDHPPRPPPASDFDSMPPKLRHAIERGLRPAPARRFPTMRALQRALRPRRLARVAATSALVVGVVAVVMLAVPSPTASIEHATRAWGRSELVDPAPDSNADPGPAARGGGRSLVLPGDGSLADELGPAPLPAPQTPSGDDVPLGPARFECAAETLVGVDPEDWSERRAEVRDHVDALNGRAEAFVSLGRHADAHELAVRALDLLVGEPEGYQHAVARFVRARALGVIDGRADAFAALRTLETMHCRSARRGAAAVRAWLHTR